MNHGWVTVGYNMVIELCNGYIMMVKNETWTIMACNSESMDTHGYLLADD